MPSVCQKLRQRARKLVLIFTLIAHICVRNMAVTWSGCHIMYQNSTMFLKHRGRLGQNKMPLEVKLSVIKYMKKQYYYTGYECNKKNTQLEIIEHVHNLKAKNWK